MIDKNCSACVFSYMEPDSPLICGHKDSGLFGLSLAGMSAPSKEGGHCGPGRTKFEQHPRRNEDGTLKGGV